LQVTLTSLKTQNASVTKLDKYQCKVGVTHMMEIAAAISLASTAFNALKKGMETGREIEDMIDYFGKWFEAKEALSEQSINSQNQPLVKKLFSGNSVEAQALQITHAKHKIKQMEKELYEYLLYTGQQEFYNDMMRERRAIREARFREAQRIAERRKLIFDIVVGGALIVITVFLIVGMFSIVLS